MANTPAIGMILSQLLQQSGGAPPSSALPMGTPAPSLGAPSPQPSAPAAAPAAAPSSSPMASILSQAMQRLNTTAYQPTPTGGGGLDPSHPIAKVIQVLANAAGAYGWSGMPPGERVERTQLEQQKAETMARLAQAGVAQEQTAAYREQMASTAAERAKAYSENVENQRVARETQAKIAQERVDVQREMAGIREAIGKGRIAIAQEQLDQRLKMFEQSFQLRVKQVGIEQAKLDLMEQGNMIKQGFLDVARGALAQRGTVEGDQANAKLQEFTREHWIASSVFGFPDINELTSQTRGAGIPGVPSPTPTGTPTPAPAAPTPQKPRAAAPKQTGGATHTWTPQGGVQPIGGPR